MRGLIIIGIVAWIVCGMSAMIADAFGEFWERPAVRAVRVRARYETRMVRLRSVWWMRERRRVAVAWLRVASVDVRRRWGFLRGASVLTWVCVPVWAVRYGVWERVQYLHAAWVMFRFAVTPRNA